MLIFMMFAINMLACQSGNPHTHTNETIQATVHQGEDLENRRLHTHNKSHNVADAQSNM